MAWHQLTDWASPWTDDPDLRVCFGRNDDRVIVVQHRRGSEVYSFQTLAPVLISEASLPMQPVADHTPAPEIQKTVVVRNFWNLSTPPPAAVPDETPPRAEAEEVEPLGMPASERTILHFPRPLPPSGAMADGPLTMFYAQTPFARQEPKRRRRLVIRWLLRIIGVIAALVLLYLIWAAMSRAGWVYSVKLPRSPSGFSGFATLARTSSGVIA
jgi:hypothetical protein